MIKGGDSRQRVGSRVSQREKSTNKSQEVKTSLACLMCKKVASVAAAPWMRSRAHGHEV